VQKRCGLWKCTFLFGFKRLRISKQVRNLHCVTSILVSLVAEHEWVDLGHRCKGSLGVIVSTVVSFRLQIRIIVLKRWWLNWLLLHGYLWQTLRTHQHWYLNFFNHFLWILGFCSYFFHGGCEGAHTFRISLNFRWIVLNFWIARCSLMFLKDHIRNSNIEA